MRGFVMTCGRSRNRRSRVSVIVTMLVKEAVVDYLHGKGLSSSVYNNGPDWLHMCDSMTITAKHGRGIK